MSGKLTVIIPCKNEIKHIVACIQSAQEVANEVLVADSGSTDGTLEAVREIGCRLVEREYIHSGDFKNWAIPQATHEWVLVVDADERVSPEMTAEIKQLIANPKSQDGYWIFRNNYFLGQKIRFSSWGHDSVLRLFKKEYGKYVGETDHAEVQISTGRVGKLRSKFEHYSFPSYEHYIMKLDRYTYWDARQKHAAGIKPKYLRLYFSGPLRFLQQYIVRLGRLDGCAGFQIATLTGYYSYLKQARLWELYYKKEPESESLNPSKT